MLIAVSEVCSFCLRSARVPGPPTGKRSMEDVYPLSISGQGSAMLLLMTVPPLLLLGFYCNDRQPVVTRTGFSATSQYPGCKRPTTWPPWPPTTAERRPQHRGLSDAVNLQQIIIAQDAPISRSPTQDLMALEVFSGAGYVAQAFRGVLNCLNC